jgi:hypothetical protein
MNTDLTEGNEGNEGIRRQDHEEQDHRVKQKGKIVDGKIMKRITNLRYLRYLRFEISNRKVCAAAETFMHSSTDTHG